YVAGSEVVKGTLVKGSRVFVDRGGEKVHQGKITSLRVLKDEVKEVKKGIDCGILIEPNVAVEEGDDIVSIKIERY
ncbi:MAG TPA: translation initiation factor IF-2, partial [Candidatus Dojkabacteria bacterium]|nr:translation initiation factor IF-2 [Candidatus Dojkabacteria bacterium]